MSDVQQNTQKMIDIINRQRSGVIVLQSNPSIDGVAAATALYLSLTKMNKHVSVVCAQPPTDLDLTGVDKIQDTFASGGNHLVISFPYKEGAIDKVDYNIANDAFNLIIIPNSETDKINPKDVKFSYTGGKIEFIITVDVPNLNSIGSLYTDNQNEFQSKNIINIDRHLINNSFGTVNIINKQASSTSEMVYQILREMNAEIDKDTATNLYTGLLAATNNFSSYSVNPTTFEAAAFLMKQGAVKKNIGNQQQHPGGQMNRQSPFAMMPGEAQGQRPNQAFPPPMPQMNDNMMPKRQPQFRPQQRPPMPQFQGGRPFPQENNQMPQQEQQPEQPQESQQVPETGNQNEMQQNNQSDQNKKNPQDWLKPKLFRGSNLM